MNVRNGAKAALMAAGLMLVILVVGVGLADLAGKIGLSWSAEDWTRVGSVGRS